jgi:hypothetical protein
MAEPPEVFAPETAEPKLTDDTAPTVPKSEYVTMRSHWMKAHAELLAKYRDLEKACKDRFDKDKATKKTLRAEKAVLETDNAALKLQVAALKAGGGGGTLWVAKTDDKENRYTVRPRHPIIKPFPTSPLPRQSLGRHPVQVGPPPRTRIKADGTIVRAAEPAIEQDYRVGFPSPPSLSLSVGGG